jgi:hypothetical protein
MELKTKQNTWENKNSLQKSRTRPTSGKLLAFSNWLRLQCKSRGLEQRIKSRYGLY